MAKHTKFFYRSIARIRAVNQKNGAILIERLKSVFKIGWLRASKLKEELVDAGVLREWNDNDFKKLPKKVKAKGNIIWKNLGKYKVPKRITDEERIRLNEERKKGLFPKTISDLHSRNEKAR